MRGGWANRYGIAATLLFVAAALYFVLIELHRPAATPALDVYVYFLPNKLHAVYSAWRGGSGLLWNPYQSCGEPFFANTAMGLLYPPHLLFLVLDPNVALHLVLILNMVLGAAGMCLLARQVGLGWAAAIGGALVLELGDPMSHLTGWSPMQNGPWAWAPWALFLCERLLRRPSRGGVAALAAVLTLELLPGWVLITALTYQVIALRVAWELVTVRSAQTWRAAAAIAIGLALAPCLAAVQLLPAAELARESFRVATEVMDFLHYGADMPDIARIVRGRVPPVPFMAAPLLLAVMAPFVSTQRRLVTFYLLVGCLYGVLALGRGTPLFDLYAHLPPGPATLRYPTRLFWICGLCMAVLSAFGIDALAQRARARAAALAPLVGAALLVALYLVTPGGLRAAELIALAALLAATVIALAKPSLGRAAAWAGVGALLLNLVAVPLHYPGRLVPSIEAMWRHADAFTALDPPVTAQDRIFINSSVKSLNDFTLMQKTATLVRLPDIHDYEALLGRRHTEYITTMWRGMPVNGVDDLFTKHTVMGGFRRRLLDLAAVRYVITVPEGEMESWGLDLPRVPVSDTDLIVYRNDHALPRARFVPRIEVVADRSVLLNRLAYGSDDLAAVALVEDAMPSGFTGADGAAASGSARFVRDDAEHVVIDVDAPARGFLVLADQYYPGWRATVNGAAVPIYRANHMFRLVEVPAGTSRVEFSYFPTSLVLGGAISALGLAVLGFMLRPLRRA
jgi:hypothetical protein